MNITAITITAIICVTLAYISTHSNGESNSGKDEKASGKESKDYDGK